MSHSETINSPITNTHDLSTFKRPYKSDLHPGELHVLKRDNMTILPFSSEKIKAVLIKAFLSTQKTHDTLSQATLDIIEEVTGVIHQTLKINVAQVPVVSVEKIQDMIEKSLMERGIHQVARNFILYRERRHEIRRQKDADKDTKTYVISSGSEELHLTDEYLISLIKAHLVELNECEPMMIYEETRKNIYYNMSLKDLYQAMIMASRTLIETEPEYSYACARFLSSIIYKEALDYLSIDQKDATNYSKILQRTIEAGVKNDILDAALKDFDIEFLASKIRPERDKKFGYLGLQTLYDRYFLHDNLIRYEIPQIFFMRIAMGLAIREDDKNARAVEFYDLLSSFDYMSSTPTLFNSGTTRPQLSSCYLTTVPDDLSGIYNAIRDNALLSKYAGGLGNDWTNVRGINSHIKGTNGQSQGVIPFLKVVNDTAVAVNQGGKRKGAVCAYLETWHRDIEDFLELRKNTGDDRRRTHDMNTANWVPDLFMERVENDEQWTLFSPDQVPNLHDLYGKAFKTEYERYELLAKEGKIKNTKSISAKGLWRKMLGMIFETGHPWITFKDPCNLRSPQQHAGVVHSSNLCTEITLNTSEEEIAVCNLGSVNLVAHMKDGKIDEEKLSKTIKTAIRMLDNVIDINFYSVPQARHSNLQHRPIGLGLMGFHDALYMMDVPYSSARAVEFADESMELISYYAIEASADLAQERGSYSSFEGSLWSKGMVPVDSLDILKQHRPEHLDIDQSSRLNWDYLREKVKKGMRNSNVLAIAPTATIANICGVSQSIEPAYQNLYVKSNLSGEFTVINPYLVKKLKERGLMDSATLHDLKSYNGQLGKIERIPSDLKELFATAFEIDQVHLVDAAAKRQKWIDQSQSLNLYVAAASGKYIDKIYKHAWKKGLKTTYYCRSLGATDAEKSTIYDGKLNAVAAKSCSIDNPSCEACQ